MLHRGMLGGVALLGLLAGAAANADGRYYGSQPQIRLGIDVVWGNHGPVYVAPPPVVWYPSHYAPPRYNDDRGYDRGHDRGYGRAKWKGNGHRKHRHDSRRGDDCDD